jgi:hypothetical protein
LKIKLHFNSLIILSITFGLLPCNGQVQDSTKKSYKNTVYINVTNPLIFGSKYNVLGYERILKNSQSVSVNFGRFALPKFGQDISNELQLQNDYKDKGYHVSFEYRWYIKKENKYPAPRGIYIGPYYAYNYFERKNTWYLNTNTYIGDLKSDLKMNMNFVGFQMGYQFVFWKRLSIDMVFMGPGVWFFDLKTKMSTTLDPDDQALLLEKLNQKLNDKIPGYNLVFSDGEIKKTGSSRSGKLGLRLVLNVGFRF